jgi:chlorobactene glucosyltransferase
MDSSTILSNIIEIIVILAQLTTFILLPLLSIRVFRNLRFLWNNQYSSLYNQKYPRVSVLVPARNEADNITVCLESLANQDYPNYEIWVLDDQSTDNTLDLIQRLAVKYPLIHIVRGESAPPSDWNGKSYACHRLSEQADGEWLLFTDADTIHTTQSIRLGIQQAHHLTVDLLSAMPRQITKSWSEWILVSFIMDFLPMLGIDLKQMWRGQGSHGIANGQYLLIRQSVYQVVGGHTAISSAMVDDFALANTFLQGDKPITFVNGTSMLACRMYHNTKEVWQGFSKNIVLSLQTSKQWSIGSIALFAWGYVSLFVLPYLIFVFHPDKLLALIAISWLMALRLIVGFVIRRPVTEALLTLFSALGVMLLGLNAIWLKVRKQRILWKDRPYSSNQ